MSDWALVLRGREVLQKRYELWWGGWHGYCSCGIRFSEVAASLAVAEAIEYNVITKQKVKMSDVVDWLYILSSTLQWQNFS